MSKYFKLAMFITSFIPLWITVAFIDILSIIRNDTDLWSEIIGLFTIGIFLLISIIIVYFSFKKIEDTNYSQYKIKAATKESGLTTEFLLSYVLPLFAFDFTRWDGVVQFLIYFIIIAFLCIRNNNIYANLIFEIMKYRFYQCEIEWIPELDTPSTNAIIISKFNLCAKKGHNIEIAKLNKPFYIAKDLEV
jgi:hypothetical protein